MSNNSLSYLTGGLVPDGNSIPASIISNGLPNLVSATPTVGITQTQIQSDGTLTGQNQQALINSVTDSITVYPTTNISPLELDPAPQNTQLIQLTPYPELTPSMLGVKERSPDGGYISYAGTNIQAIIEIGDNPSGPARFAKQLVELTTLSISIHRAHSAAWGLGFIGAKGYARGRRTVAGTMVFTQFTKDVLFEFLNSSVVSDLSKDTTYVKVDQLPLFNMTILFTSEYGYMSYRRLYGISFMNDGTVYSTNDLMTEQVLAYVASDFTPLTNVDNNSATAMGSNLKTNPLISNEQTPLHVLTANTKI